MPLLTLFVSKQFGNRGKQVEPKLVLFFVRGKMECGAYPEEKLQCNAEGTVLFLFDNVFRQVFDGIDMETYLADPKHQIGIAETANPLFEVWLHRQRVLLVFLCLLFQFLSNETFYMVMTDAFDGILCMGPDKMGPLDKA